MLSLPPPLSLLQLFPPIPTEWGLEQGMTLIISLAIWLQGGESVECVFSVARELQDESGLCVCVSLTQALSSCPPSSRRTCSAWAGLTLTSEKSDNRSDVTSSWAHTYGHTRRLMRCSSAHTRQRNCISHNSTTLTSRKCCSKWRSCKHCSSLVRWRSQKSSNAVSVSSS